MPSNVSTLLGEIIFGIWKFFISTIILIICILKKRNILEEKFINRIKITLRKNSTNLDKIFIKRRTKLENKLRRYDKIIAFIFAVLILIFLFLAFTNKEFFNWAYERRQNQISWYIRPLFLIPFCYSAYKRSWTGILGTMFLILTSMFWFPKPDVVSEQVKRFLEMEKEYLSGDWGYRYNI